LATRKLISSLLPHGVSLNFLAVEVTTKPERQFPSLRPVLPSVVVLTGRSSGPEIIDSSRLEEVGGGRPTVQAAQGMRLDRRLFDAIHRTAEIYVVIYADNHETPASP
jgi:hypothetical protein